MRQVRLQVIVAFAWAGFMLGLGSASGAVRLPAIFGDHMVLQQDGEAALWGWAEAGETVKIEPSWAEAEAVETEADETGAWRAMLSTPGSGGPYEIAISGGEGEAIRIADVLVGEVWLCSGQSNMQWQVNQAAGAEEAIAGADKPGIRLFTVKRDWARTEQEDVTGSWQVCTPETAGEFSAVGYFFGRELHEELGSPVGLVNSSWGGTPAEAWTSGETLREIEGYDRIVELISNPDEAKELATARWQEYRLELFEWEKQLIAVDPGSQQRWYRYELDTSDWQGMELPGTWQGTDLESVDGVVWFRKITNLPPAWARRDLVVELGPIDDIDTVWVNGVYVGTTSDWSAPRRYRVPANALRVGPNVIAVRVIDTGGEGGFSGVAENMRIGLGGESKGAWATLATEWKYKLSYTGTVPGPPPSPGQMFHKNSPTVLYNAMIAPLAGYGMAGAIWYQGEANVDRPMEYRTLFPALIRDWREQWVIGEFPFYYVQIAPFAYGGRGESQYLREAQMMTLEKVENTGMAVTMDVAAEHDIHPREKVTVGERLALWALAERYGREGLVYSGPLYRDMQVEGEAIRLYFDHADGGLEAGEGGLRDFVIAGEDRKFVPAEARIEGEEVVVRSDAVSKPVAVRYGWSDWVDGSLFNAAGLPASSFRTDDWATVEDAAQPWAALVED